MTQPENIHGQCIRLLINSQIFSRVNPLSYHTQFSCLRCLISDVRPPTSDLRSRTTLILGVGDKWMPTRMAFIKRPSTFIKFSTFLSSLKPMKSQTKRGLSPSMAKVFWGGITIEHEKNPLFTILPFLESYFPEFGIRSDRGASHTPNQSKHPNRYPRPIRHALCALRLPSDVRRSSLPRPPLKRTIGNSR